MSIRCGNHSEKTYHETITDVRACFAGAVGGEQTYGDVILTDGELAKIAAGIRDMESEGILPRTGSSRPTFATRTQQAPTAPVGYMARTTETRLSPKGNTIPEEFGGSPKQYDYMLSMVEELGQADTYDWSLIRSVRHGSVAIDSLKDKVQQHRQAARRAPVKQTVTDSAATVTQDGIYRNPATGEIFKVQVAVHGSGNLYAKQAYLDSVDGSVTRIPLKADELDEHEDPAEMRVEWAYRPGLLGKIKPEWKVTRDEAVAFGALYGCCIRCNRTLTKESSIEAAMGDICRGKLGF